MVRGKTEQPDELEIKPVSGHDNCECVLDPWKRVRDRFGWYCNRVCSHDRGLAGASTWLQTRLRNAIIRVLLKTTQKEE